MRAPDITRENQLAIDAWIFCGSRWAPELVMMAVAMYDITDIELLFEQLLTIRSAVERFEKAQRE